MVTQGSTVMQVMVEVPDCLEFKEAKCVEVSRGMTARGTTLWINVDGICRMRVYNYGELDLTSIEEANPVPT